MNPAFNIARETATNIGQGIRQSRDQSAIENILSGAIQSGNPEIIQDSIGKILSQVSPQNQGAALQYLQGAYQSALSRQDLKQKEALGRQAAKEGGYTYGAPPQVQAQQAKDLAKTQRLNQYGLKPQDVTITDESEVITPSFKDLSEEKLIELTGAPDREISEPAKAQLTKIQEDRKFQQKEREAWKKYGMERAKKVLDRADEISETIPQKQTALNLMKEATLNRNLSFFSPDNIAEITGIEAFRSPEGALFKTAGKEYFLGNISRAGARPNQWIEQQIADMLAKIGRSRAANLSVERALQNELDLDKSRINFTSDVYDEYINDEKDLGKIGSEIGKRMQEFAVKKQKELFNDLRAISAIDEEKPKKFQKVEKDTPLTDYMANALLMMFNDDYDKAKEEAEKLGYQVEE